MALTKLPKNAIADDAVNSDKIADGTIQNQDVQGSISNDKLENSSFTFNGTEISLGASQSIVTFLDWQAVTVADGSTTLTAESGKGYFLDTNAGVIEVFLPTSPSRGDVIGLVDYSGTFGTNQLIINTGGVNIDSTVGSDFKVTTNNSIVELIYVDSAKGWLVYLSQAAGTTPDSALIGFGGYDTVEPTFISATGGTVTTSGDFKIHTFTGDGCFVISDAGGGIPTHPSTVDYLVIAGAGGGGGEQSGGGGAGGYRESHSTCNSGCYTASPLATPTGITVTAQTYPITVGGGGNGGQNPCTNATEGSPSIFSTITSAGGGRGGTSTDPHPAGNATTGGSGGGGATLGGAIGAAGNTPPVSPPQGNPGGNGAGAPYVGGGGGGAGGAGNNGIGAPSPPGAAQAGPGGNGTTSSINGTPTTRAGGGGAGGTGATVGGNQPYNAGTGGPGGGGAGAPDSPSTNGTAGTANTGSGGGGGNLQNPSSTGGAGGKGIVIIRYRFQ